MITNFKITLLVASTLCLFVLNSDITQANFSFQDRKISVQKSNDYLDFSYISFVIQMIIGGAVAGTVALIAYYRKFSNFIFKFLSKNKDKKDENKKN